MGLRTDADGEPVSVEVFQGTTQDVKTFGSQIHPLARMFGCRQVTVVGDRGLIQQLGIEVLQAEAFYFIRALPKPHPCSTNR